MSFIASIPYFVVWQQAAGSYPFFVVPLLLLWHHLKDISYVFCVLWKLKFVLQAICAELKKKQKIRARFLMLIFILNFLTNFWFEIFEPIIQNMQQFYNLILNSIIVQYAHVQLSEGGHSKVLKIFRKNFRIKSICLLELN